jgi:hypothetical protein
MATYPPPTETLPTFNSTVFTSPLTDGLTIAEADGRYLKFPSSQGGETINGDLVVSGITTLDGATFTNNNPEYRIEYPVNSGRIDFFTNTAGGVLTRGCKIDSTGVHTNGKFDTINETGGTLDIGVNNDRTAPINIGTGTSTAKNINIGAAGIGVCNINSYNVNIRPVASGGDLFLGDNMTGGNLRIGGSVGGTTTIEVGNGSSQSGAIQIGTGASVKPITIGNNTGGTTTITGDTVTIRPSATGFLNLGDNMTNTGSITMGGGTGGSSSILIGVGNSQTGQIAIGNGTSSKSITIGNNTGGTTTITGANALLRPSTSVGIGDSMTGGTITIGRSDGTSTNTTINIGMGAAQSGNMNIGNGAGSLTTNIGRSNAIQIVNSGTTVLTVNRPITIGYSNNQINTTDMIGYKADIAGLVLAATMPTSVGNITTSSFSILGGVWIVNLVLQINYATAPSAATYVRMSLSTASATRQDARTIDFNPNDSGANFCNYTTTISNATATNYFVVGQSGGSVNPSITSLVVNITRIA